MADWAIHIFREHNKEADSSGKGVKGREEEGVDTVGLVWSEVLVCVVSGTVAARTVRAVPEL